MPVPMHLRNAPTKLMKELGHGSAYRYAHDEEAGHAAGENYWPEGMQVPKFYEPTDRGLESKIAEKLNWGTGWAGVSHAVQRQPRDFGARRSWPG